MNSLICVLYPGIPLPAHNSGCFRARTKMGGVIQSVDERQFVDYFLFFNVCQRSAICSNMDRRMPELMYRNIFVQNKKFERYILILLTFR